VRFGCSDILNLRLADQIGIYVDILTWWRSCDTECSQGESA
jgi:hypothetical protein